LSVGVGCTCNSYTPLRVSHADTTPISTPSSNRGSAQRKRANTVRTSDQTRTQLFFLRFCFQACILACAGLTHTVCFPCLRRNRLFAGQGLGAFFRKLCRHDPVARRRLALWLFAQQQLPLRQFSRAAHTQVLAPRAGVPRRALTPPPPPRFGCVGVWVCG
jgi:hypothetical protein